MARKQVSGYVDAEEKQSFKAHAEAADLSLSEWVAQACREKKQREALGDAADQFKLERRLLALVDDAADQAADRIVEEVLGELGEHVEEIDAGDDIDDDYSDWGR